MRSLGSEGQRRRCMGVHKSSHLHPQHSATQQPILALRHAKMTMAQATTFYVRAWYRPVGLHPLFGLIMTLRPFLRHHSPMHPLCDLRYPLRSPRCTSCTRDSCTVHRPTSAISP